MMVEPCCREVRELLPELALGLASGDDRARTLAHVERCAECRAVLERTAATVDELLLLAPEHEAPAGFDARVLDAMQPGRPRSRRLVAPVAAAAAVLIGLVGVLATRWVDAGDRELAAQYRSTLQVADGSYLQAARLTSDTGVEAGHVFAYQGRPSWVFMTVEGAPSGAYPVTMATRDGRVHQLGNCWVRHGRASWGTSVDVPIRSIDHIEMSWRGVRFTAQLG